jgi:transposase
MGCEVIEVVERRRRWPAEVRLRLLDEAMRAGASVAAVADRHGVSRGLIYQWLKQVREGRMPELSLRAPGPAVAFAPVRVVSEENDARTKSVPTPSLPPPPAKSAGVAPTCKRRSGVVEIRLANGRVLKVDESIEAQALARLLAVVDGDRS